MLCYPLYFIPVYKAYVWGGDRIVRRYSRAAPTGNVAESWEISDRPEGMSLVVNGPLAGQSLHALVQDYGIDFLGARCAPGRFPLLIKILDARERLSVQVHPDNASAPIVGGEPKTEVWYVLEAEPDAMVFAGVKSGVTAIQFRQALRDGDITNLLNAIPVVAGDVVYVPGGRVHAVGAGCLLLEVQQNSDTTYRLFDWNRVGPDGTPRDLHVDQALKAIRWTDTEPTHLPATEKVSSSGLIRERLVSPYFRLEQVTVGATIACSTEWQSFHLLFIEHGSVQVKTHGAIVAAGPGMTLLLPAAVGAYEITGQVAPGHVIRIRLP